MKATLIACVLASVVRRSQRADTLDQADSGDREDADGNVGPKKVLGALATAALVLSPAAGAVNPTKDSAGVVTEGRPVGSGGAGADLMGTNPGTSWRDWIYGRRASHQPNDPEWDAIVKKTDEMTEGAYPWHSIARTFLGSMGTRGYQATKVVMPAIEGLVRLIKQKESQFPASMRAEAIAGFEDLTRSFQSHEIRGAATAALAEVGRADDPRVIDTLVGKIDSEERENAYQPALDGLVRLYPAATREQQAYILQSIESLSKTWKSANYRAAALGALSRII